MLNFMETQRSPGQKAGALTELKISAIEPSHDVARSYDNVIGQLTALDNKGAGVSMTGILGTDAASTHLSKAQIIADKVSDQVQAGFGRLIP